MTKRSRTQMDELRKKAEETLEQSLSYPREHDPDKLAHELSVHQIELEMQNEELRKSQIELEASREKYFDLYDLAPVAYVTIDENGLITEANLTSISPLGVERRHLIGRPLSAFIDQAYQDAFYRHRRHVLMAGNKRTCELVLRRKDGTLFPAELQSVALVSGERPVMRSVVIDLTERKRSEERLQEAQRMAAIGTLAGAVSPTTSITYLRLLSASPRWCSTKSPTTHMFSTRWNGY